MEKTLENKCIWKRAIERESQAEGKLRGCKSRCDGYNTNCEYYLTKQDLKEYEIK